jgi:hypothetical protein
MPIHKLYLTAELKRDEIFRKFGNRNLNGDNSAYQ